MAEGEDSLLDDEESLILVVLEGGGGNGSQFQRKYNEIDNSVSQKGPQPSPQPTGERNWQTLAGQASLSQGILLQKSILKFDTRS